MLPQYFPASTWLNGGGCSLRQASNLALLSKTDADLYWLSLQGMLIKEAEESSKNGYSLRGEITVRRGGCQAHG